MTRNTRIQLADLAEKWIRAWAGDVPRESAEVMLTYWDLNEPVSDELRDEVLGRFAPAEPPSVPGVDYLEPWEDDFHLCPKCRGPRANGWTTHCDTCDGPLVEVAPQPSTAPEVWDDSVPPGGWVCSVCRTPVESEPCAQHGAEPSTEQVQP